MAVFRNLEAVVFSEQRRFLIAIELLECGRMLLVMYIRDALEEEQRKDVALEVRRIHWPA